jgi:CheY-like chemotaxis protein
VALVVDDDPAVRRVAVRSLQRAGFVVHEAGDGMAAVELFRAQSHAIDVVVLDLVMPVMDGAETLVELQAIRPDVRVVLSSGYSEDDATQRFAGAGIAGFLQKPYPANELIGLATTIVGERARGS